MQKTTTVRTVQDTDEGDAETTAEDQPQAPLFDLSEKSDAIVSIDVHRVEPHEDEGFLAKISPSSTQSDILARFGGGKYQLDAKNAQQKYVQRRTIVIAGDPKFTSRVAEARWRRAQGLDDMQDIVPTVVTPAPTAAPAFDPLQFIQMQIAAAREEREARRLDEREREESRRREEREAEERRRKWEAEAEERRRRADEEARERERQHNATMMQMLTSKPEGGGATEAVKMLLQGLELGRNLGATRDDDDDEDGEDSLAGVIKQAVKGVAGGFMEGQRAHQRPAQNPGAPASDAVRLTGTLASKVKKLASVAKAKGLNPDELLDETVGKLAEHIEGAPTPEPEEKTSPETPAAKKAPKPKAPQKQKKQTVAK